MPGRLKGQIPRSRVTIKACPPSLNSRLLFQVNIEQIIEDFIIVTSTAV